MSLNTLCYSSSTSSLLSESTTSFESSDTFLTNEDDIHYLEKDEEWIESRAERLTSHEKRCLVELVISLHHKAIEDINPRFMAHLLPDYLGKTYAKKLSEEKRRVEVRAIFMAAPVRELILREESYENMIENRRNFLERYPFFKQQDLSPTELTRLNRFERALRYLKIVLPPQGNKQLYLNIGGNLEGSSVFTEYITGGSNRPETQRRVDIYVVLTNITPKQRTPKSEEAITPKIVKQKRPASTRSSKASSLSSTPKTPVAGQRKRGRPRKYPLPVDQQATPMAPQHFTFHLEEMTDMTEYTTSEDEEDLLMQSETSEYILEEPPLWLDESLYQSLQELSNSSSDSDSLVYDCAPFRPDLDLFDVFDSLME